MQSCNNIKIPIPCFPFYVYVSFFCISLHIVNINGLSDLFKRKRRLQYFARAAHILIIKLIALIIYAALRIYRIGAVIGKQQ